MTRAMMKKIFSPFLFGAFLFLFGFAPEPSFRLVFHEQVITEKDQVYLGDIARINTGQGMEAEGRVLAEAYVCEVPRAGYKREISRSFIIMKLKQMKLDLTRFDLLGANSVVVRRKEGVIHAAEQYGALQNWVGKKLGLARDSFSLDLKEPLEDMVMPYGNAELHFKEKGKSFLKNSTGVYMEIRINGKLQKRKSVSFELTMLREALAVINPIAQGQVITPADIQRITQKIPVALDMALASESEVFASKAAQALIPGQLLMKEDLLSNYLVDKGDQVKGGILDKNMRLTILLEAKSSGKLGEVIALDNPLTHKQVEGKVIGEKEVMVLS